MVYCVVLDIARAARRSGCRDDRMVRGLFHARHSGSGCRLLSSHSLPETRKAGLSHAHHCLMSVGLCTRTRATCGRCTPSRPADQPLIMDTPFPLEVLIFSCSTKMTAGVQMAGRGRCLRFCGPF